MQAVPGLRVIEVGERLSGAYAGLMLAAQGASVCQVRAGLERRLNEVESAYFDRGRLVLQDAAALPALIAEADLLLCDLPLRRLRELELPLTEQALQELKADLVMVAVTALGLDGPHADYEMEDITEWAAGGLAYVTRRSVPEEDDEHYSPLLAPGRQPELLGGIAAATGALAGLRLARESGRAVLVDVSRQEVQAAMLHGIVPPFVWNGIVSGSPSGRLGIGMLLPAADGEIYLRTVEQHQWAALIEWMGSPAWASEPWVTDPLQRRNNAEAVRAMIGEWTAQHPRRWLYEDGQRHRVPVAEPRTLDDVLASPQLAALDFWQELSLDGATARAPSIPLLGGAPLAGPVPVESEALLRAWAR